MSPHRESQRRVALAFAALLLLPVVVNGADLAPCHVKGLSTAVECGALEVPLDYSAPMGAVIDIGFVRLPAFNVSTTQRPLFFLAGGPGESATSRAAYINRSLSAVRSDRDIVLIDQRGTGRSSALQCEFTDDVDLASEYDLVDTDILKRCVAELPDGIAHFTTANAIRDFERVREHLGYEQIDVIGGSYGSRAAVAYLALAGASIHSVILDGISPPAVPIGLFGESASAAFDRALNRCSEIPECDAAFPNLRQDFETVSARLRQAPLEARVPHPTTGELVDTKVWYRSFISLLRLTLYSPDTTALLPLLIQRAAAGDFQPLLSLAVTASNSVGINQMLNLIIVCNEDYPRFSAEAIARDSDNRFGKNTSYSLWQTACPLMPRFDADIDWMQARDFAQPALLLSGGRDPVTPPGNGTIALELFTNARHIVAAEAAHIVSTSPCGSEMVAAFLEDADPGAVDTACLASMPRQRFRLDRLGSLSTSQSAEETP